jgi:RHS repeat-associated protein
MRAVLLLVLSLAAGAALGANNAAFVSQSVPTVMAPGQVYAVTVTMQNTGTTTWTAGTFHRLGTQNPQDNTLWTGATRVALPASVAPGANATFSFNVTAPATAGTYNFQWKMVQDGVEWFGAQSANVAVKVGLNDSAFVSQSVPPVMQPGQSYAVTATWKNTGGSTWTVAAGHKMGSQNPQDNLTWGMNRVNLPGTTAPGANATFSWNVTAPSTPGTYNFQWKTLQSGVEWFGALSTNAAVKVGLDNAAFVSQSVPATMVAGQTYEVSVTMQNTGSTTWAAGTVGLASQNPQGNTTWGPSKINLASSVAPSAQTTLTFSVTAPATPGSYNFQWKMVEGTNGWFGAQSTNVAVNVTLGAPESNMFFIHADHLNTPRLVADATGTAVWKWDQQEPFGMSPPDKNPSGLGVFDFPLRHPGQYDDPETGLFYNYFRDCYDPVLGRYCQSDPIGLRGGINTYLYVAADPIRFVDPLGLAKFCCRPLANAFFGGFIGGKHCFIVGDDGNKYSLFAGRDGATAVGVPTPNSPNDNPATSQCFDCPAPCGVNQNQCLANAFTAYPSTTYSPISVNSNTFAGTLAKKCCAGGIPSGVPSGALGVGLNPGLQ